MPALTRLALLTLPISLADLLFFLYWYHLGNAQAKFLLYGPWLVEANERFVTSGFVAGSLILFGVLGVGLVLFRLNRWPQMVTWWQAASLNALIVVPGEVLITQTANFDPPLWTSLLALVWLLMLNTALFAICQYFARLASTIALSLLVIAAYGLSAMILFAALSLILNFDTGQQWTVNRGILLLGATLPILGVLMVGALWVWHWKHQGWRRPSAMSLALSITLLWVPCFAVAHYTLGSSTHYITNADNLLSNARIALVCGPLLASLLALADALVTRWLLPIHQAVPIE